MNNLYDQIMHVINNQVKEVIVKWFRDALKSTGCTRIMWEQWTTNDCLRELKIGSLVMAHPDYHFIDRSNYRNLPLKNKDKDQFMFIFAYFDEIPPELLDLVFGCDKEVIITKDDIKIETSTR